ncbi:SDR family oxidoreductase [Synechococcus sp. CS-1328]|nr:SDR family oxidoreductase [Synechococcus sp. CS-1328]
MRRRPGPRACGCGAWARAEVLIPTPSLRSGPLRHLVTGGAGFVGSHLVDRLMQAGEEVLCLDNYFTGRKVNIAQWIGHPRFELIRHDVTEPIRLEVDRIWHLACPASPVHYQFNPIKTAKTSFLGTYNMLGLARRVGARLLLASTSEIYGDPEVHPQPESYRGCVNTIGIRSCYDEGKRVAETLCFDYLRMHGTEVRVARIFNTYGPRMLPDDGRVVSNFIVQALQGQPLTLYGDGQQTRSFCYVDDLVEGLIRLMNGAHTGPINLGNPGEFTIRELAELVRARINPGLELVLQPLPQDDPRQRQPMIDRARELLGWEPTISLEQGLEPTIADFRRQLAL